MTNECGTTTTMPLNLTVNCLGTNTVANLDKAIKLYPNPAKEWLNIELPTNIALQIKNITISNLLGQVVYNDVIPRDLGMTNVPVAVNGFQNGIYIVSLETNYGKWNGKFVKE